VTTPSDERLEWPTPLGGRTTSEGRGSGDVFAPTREAPSNGEATDKTSAEHEETGNGSRNGRNGGSGAVDIDLTGAAPQLRSKVPEARDQGDLEQRLGSAAVTGEVLDLSTERGRTSVAGSLVARAALGDLGQNSDRSLRLSGVRITGTLDLCLAKGPGLEFVDCEIERLDLDGARLGRVDLIDCSIGHLSACAAVIDRWLRVDRCLVTGGLLFDQLEVGASLVVSGSRVGIGRGGASVSAERLKVGGTLVLGEGSRYEGPLLVDGLEVGGGVDAGDLVATGRADQHAVSMVGSRIGGELRLAGLGTIDGGVELTSTRCLRLDASEMRLAGMVEGISADLSMAKVDGDVLLGDTQAVGTIRGVGLAARGRLDASGIELAGLDERPLVDLTRCEIGGPIELGRANLRGGGVDLSGARFGGFRGIAMKISGRSPRLNFDAATVDGPIVLADHGPGSSAELVGGIGLRHARVHGDVDLSSVRLIAGAGDAPAPLDATRSEVSGTLGLDSARIDGGMVSITDAHLGGLSMQVADVGRLDRTGRVSMRLDRTRVDGPVELGALHATGPISAVGLEAGDGVHLLGTRAASAATTSYGVVLDDARIDGPLRLGVSGGAPARARRAQVRGPVSFGGASVGQGGADGCTSFDGDGMSADRVMLDGAFEGDVCLNGCDITDSLVLSSAHLAGALDLTQAHVGRVVDSPIFGPAGDGYLTSGLTVVGTSNTAPDALAPNGRRGKRRSAARHARRSSGAEVVEVGDASSDSDDKAATSAELAPDRSSRARRRSAGRSGSGSRAGRNMAAARTAGAVGAAAAAKGRDSTGTEADVRGDTQGSGVGVGADAHRSFWRRFAVPLPVVVSLVLVVLLVLLVGVAILAGMEAPEPWATAIDSIIPGHSNGAIGRWDPTGAGRLVVEGGRVIGWWAILSMLCLPLIAFARSPRRKR